MTQRHALRLLLAAISVVSAGASVASGNFWIAGGMVVCAFAMVVRPLSKKVSAGEFKTFLESLRVSQQVSTPAVNAVVGATFIFVGNSAIYGESNSGNALLFRDEIDDPVWRELATLLRHQAHPSSELKRVDRKASLRLGKSSDL